MQIRSRTRTAVGGMTSLWSRHKRCFELEFVKKQDRPQSWQGVDCAADYWKSESHRLDLKKYIDPCISCYKEALHWNKIFPEGYCSYLFTYCFFNPIINIKIGIVISKAWLIAYTNSVFCMICADVTQFHYQLICALNFTRSLGSSWCTYSSVSTGNESRFISN